MVSELDSIVEEGLSSSQAQQSKKLLTGSSAQTFSNVASRLSNSQAEYNPSIIHSVRSIQTLDSHAVEEANDSEEFDVELLKP